MFVTAVVDHDRVEELITRREGSAVDVDDALSRFDERRGVNARQGRVVVRGIFGVVARLDAIVVVGGGGVRDVCVEVLRREPALIAHDRAGGQHRAQRRVPRDRDRGTGRDRDVFDGERARTVGAALGVEARDAGARGQRAQGARLERGVELVGEERVPRVDRAGVAQDDLVVKGLARGGLAQRDRLARGEDRRADGDEVGGLVIVPVLRRAAAGGEGVEPGLGRRGPACVARVVGGDRGLVRQLDAIEGVVVELRLVDDAQRLARREPSGFGQEAQGPEAALGLPLLDVVRRRTLGEDLAVTPRHRDHCRGVVAHLLGEPVLEGGLPRVAPADVRDGEREGGGDAEVDVLGAGLAQP